MDKSSIKVYNYSGSIVCVKTKNREVTLMGAQDGVPAMETFTFEELEYINANCALLRNGRLEFDEDERDEVYVALKINNSDCLYESEIDDLLMNYTEENVRRILAITDDATFERLRGHMIYHGNLNDLDISNRMSDLVNKRYKELLRGIRNTRILVKPVVAQNTIPQETLDEIKAAAIKEALQAVAAQQAAVQPAAVNKPEPVIETVAEKPAAKPKATSASKTTTTAAKRGRPAATTKKTATK